MKIDEGGDKKSFFKNLFIDYSIIINNMLDYLYIEKCTNKQNSIISLIFG